MEISVSILDHIKDPIIVLNTSFNIEFQNKSAIDLFDNDQKGQHISLLVRDPIFLEYIEDAGDNEDNEGIEITFDSSRLIIVLAPSSLIKAGNAIDIGLITPLFTVIFIFGACFS